MSIKRIQKIGDTYEPGTRREREYQLGMLSIFYTDSIEETAILANMAIQSDKSVEALEVVEEEAAEEIPEVLEPQKTQDCIEVL